MAEKKNGGNTKPKWFVKERAMAWAKLEEMYQESLRINIMFRIVDDNVMIEQYHCLNSSGGYDVVNIQVNRGVDAPYSSVFKQVLLTEKGETI